MNGGFGFHFSFGCERRIVRMNAYKLESIIELLLGSELDCSSEIPVC